MHAVKGLPAAVLVLGLVGLPFRARGYLAADSFLAPALQGGGGGSFFSGSPAGHRYDCSICHVGGPGRSILRIATSSASLAETSQWTPGQTYRITVELAADRAGVASRTSALAVEIVDGNGAPAGVLSPTSGSVERPQDTSVIFASGSGPTAWTFQWVAPDAASDELALYVAGVLGNSGLGEDRPDPWGDDVAVLRIALDPDGPSDSPKPTYAAQGCSAAGPNVATGISLSILATVAASGLLRRKHRRATRYSALIQPTISVRNAPNCG